MKYKRLTNKNWKENDDIFEDCYSCDNECGCCSLNYKALKRLAELEDKIETAELELKGEKQIMKMKPCPFCGSEKLKIDSKTKTGFDNNCNSITIHSFSVRCNVCHARGPIYTNKKDRQRHDYRYKSKQEWIDEAIKLWNNRKGE